MLSKGKRLKPETLVKMRRRVAQLMQTGVNTADITRTLNEEGFKTANKKPVTYRAVYAHQAAIRAAKPVYRDTTTLIENMSAPATWENSDPLVLEIIESKRLPTAKKVQLIQAYYSAA